MKMCKRFGMVAVALLLAAAMMVASAVPVMASGEQPVVSVTGNGAIPVTPDMATITLGVSTLAPTARQALDQNSAAMNRVRAEVRRFGIADADISTQWFNIWEQQEWTWDDMLGTSTSRVVGFNVSNTLVVTVRNIDQVGDILSAGITAGANASSGISFGVSNTHALYLQALAAAVADARTKANVLAGALGMTVGNPILVVETQTWSTLTTRQNFSADMVVPQAAGSAVPVEAGEMFVTARVQVDFELR